MSIAKNILDDVSYWYPQDLDLALRAYGSTSPSESNNCSDSVLLVPFSDFNREPIRASISDLRPTGQTPIAFALDQAAHDNVHVVDSVTPAKDVVASILLDPSEKGKHLNRLAQAPVLEEHGRSQPVGNVPNNDILVLSKTLKVVLLGED